MRERLQVLALAGAALALFYVLAFPKPGAQSEEIRPVSTERLPDGYLAVWRWLAEQRVPLVSLRYRYDRLSGLLARPTGNLLIATLPQQVPARAAELDALRAWIDRGNTLLVMAALDDTPAWSVVGADPLLLERLERMTGLHIEPVPSASRAKPPQSERAPPPASQASSPRSSSPQPLPPVSHSTQAAGALHLRPQGSHALLADVKDVTVLTPEPVARWHVRTGSGGIALELAQLADHDRVIPALWLARRGAGQIILCAAATPFSNAAVGLGDNARLLANILGWSLRDGGAVIFDDAHQGSTAYYDGKAFFADPRLHRTLVWIVLLWLAFVLGSQPLRATRPAWEPLDETAYVEAVARYLAAVVRPADAARRLIEDFLEGLRARWKLDAGASIWRWLDAQAAVTPAELQALQAQYAAACAGERIDLVRLQNRLANLGRKLA